VYKANNDDSKYTQLKNNAYLDHSRAGFAQHEGRREYVDKGGGVVVIHKGAAVLYNKITQ
jgi:hypothetical protein